MGDSDAVSSSVCACAEATREDPRHGHDDGGGEPRSGQRVVEGSWASSLKARDVPVSHGGDRASRAGHYPPAAALSLRQPPARLLATICSNIACNAGALIVSPSWMEICRPVLLPWPLVMMFSGSGTIAPS